MPAIQLSYPAKAVEFLVMPENAAALAHYYHLRSQGVDPVIAKQHVRQRFGIDIGDVPEADAVTTPADPPEREPMEFGGDFGQTIYGTSTGPQYGK